MNTENLNKIYLTNKEVFHIIELLRNNDNKQLARGIKEQLFKKDLPEHENINR